MSDQYEVGYGKPPRKNQFQKGNQAAKGRAKSTPKSVAEPALHMPTIIAKALKTKRTARRGDHVVEMTAAEILVERLVLQMTNGSSRDLRGIVALLEKHLPEVLASPPEPLEIIYHRAEGSTVELPTASFWEGRGA